MRVARAVLLLLIIAVAAARTLPAQPERIPDLLITHIDVGLGDATLVITPQGKRVLIDGGWNYWTGGFIRLMKVDTLDLVIVTNNHEDHVGGIEDVLNRFVVREYVDNGIAVNDKANRYAQRAIRDERGMRYSVGSRRTIRLGDLTVQLLPPARADTTQKNNSVGVLLEYGRFRALFTGDAEAPALSAWLRARVVPEVTLLLISNHGALRGTTPEWISATSPEIVVASVDRGNKPDAPSPAVIAEWRAARARVYRTDSAGTIFVRARRDGSYIVRTLSEALATQQKRP